MNAVTVLQPSRLPIAASLAKEFEIGAAEWRVLVDQIFPAAQTVEAISMALSYCRARKLDIYKKPVHIVPMWSAALGRMVESVWPGISEIRTTAARTGDYGGIDEVIFGPMIEREFTGEKDKWENKRKVGTETVTKKVRYPEWASVVVYRWVHGEKAAFHTKIFWEETYASLGKMEVPNDMWGKRPRGQLDKCVEAAALRKAFPEEVGSMYAAEEMEGRTLIEHEATMPPAPPPAPTAKIAAPTEKPVEIDGEVFDGETGELVEEEIVAPPPPAAKKAATAPAKAEFANPDDMLKDAEERFSKAQDEGDWGEVHSEFVHLQETLFPPDWDRLVSIMSRHFDRVSMSEEERAALKQHPINGG
ncbi:phage recombination protein Bet [Mesorhizobium onobrychidis]|uniref:Phage recombination protein Bet n=1 Tax=Mesorhizobium onobrychidis TaxID=2775404 RepID=A0ABY5QUN9_9HYPH|nr:phage recombination protein Bet [Mesorhizobium onobrychidis]UVC14748.1 phage recombination protein Bet [Mesorhizobium onobrychidis]